MGTVLAQASMSVDGYIAKTDNTIGRLFDWLQNGEVEIPAPAGDLAVHLTPASAEHWRARPAGRPDPLRPGRAGPAPGVPVQR